MRQPSSAMPRPPVSVTATASAVLTGARAAPPRARSKVVRKNVAQVLTVINQTTKMHLRKEYKGKDLKPLDLRFKKTRAIRRALTKKEASLKTTKQMKKEKHFPLRKYAVKA
mmetsp:Transcript_18436/g.47442  ORF Transcript_18436/g.47442 Transcript_18436/m.47442 type:complete len:112 (+) Transcript_18436:524-859(+)